MGFFTQNNIAPVDGLAPLTAERIVQEAQAMEWNVDVDEDGDVLGAWEGGSFVFTRLGNPEVVLMVRGSWYGQLPAERAAELEEAVAEWNRATAFPKAYTMQHEETGAVKVVTEFVMDYQHGVSAKQLSLHLYIGVSTAEQLFEALGEQFPEGMPTE